MRIKIVQIEVALAIFFFSLKGLPLWGRTQTTSPQEAAPKPTKGILEDSLGVGSYLERIAFVQRQIAETNGEIEAVGKNRDLLVATQQNLRQKIKNFGLTASNQLNLIESRRTLPSLSQCQADLKRVNLLLDRVELERLRLEDPRSFVGEAPTDDKMASAPPVTIASTPPTGPSRARIEGGSKRQELLAAIADYRARLVALSLALTELSSTTVEMQQFLDGQLMWVRDCEPLGGNDLRKSIEGGWMLAQPGQWIELGGGLLQRIVTRPYELALLAAGLISISLTSRWLNRWSR